MSKAAFWILERDEFGNSRSSVYQPAEGRLHLIMRFVSRTETITCEVAANAEESVACVLYIIPSVVGSRWNCLFFRSIEGTYSLG